MKNARLCVQSFKKTLPASHVSRSNEGTLTKFAATSNPLFTPNYHRDRRSEKIKIVAKDSDERKRKQGKKLIKIVKVKMNVMIVVIVVIYRSEGEGGKRIKCEG